MVKHWKYGETLEKGPINAKEAIEFYIESLKAHGEETLNVL